jgi:hypothetical protein
MMNSLQTGYLISALTHLGRFPTLRRIYSFLMRFRKRSSLIFHPNNIEVAGTRIAKSWSTYFDTELIGECLNDLNAKGISQQLRLPDSVVDEVIEYARSVPFRDVDGQSTFMMSDLENGLSSSDISGSRGIFSNVSTSPHLMKILNDYVLCQIATQYLGYEPSTVEAYLEILLAPRTADAPGKYRPFEYHYDVPGFNFIGFFFYLSDVDHTTGGAHAMILNSNRDKPLRFMLQSAQSAGKHVFEYYNQEAELIVHGQKGTGFAEDLYAFHKVTRPKSKDRLAFHIRYY